MQQQAENNDDEWMLSHTSQQQSTQIHKNLEQRRDMEGNLSTIRVFQSHSYYNNDAILKFTSAAYAMDLSVVIHVRKFAAVSYGRRAVCSDVKR